MHIRGRGGSGGAHSRLRLFWCRFLEGIGMDGWRDCSLVGGIVG